MSAASRLRYAYLAYFSKPKAERKLYRTLKARRPVRIVELGLKTVERTLRMIQVAERFAPGQRVEYTGFDRFDARPEDAEPLSLILAYRRLKTTSARIKLIPGDPAQTLRGAANSLSGVDLLLISGDLDAAAMQASWYYVPRMLHAQTLILQMPAADDATGLLAPLAAVEIEHRAQSVPRRRAA